MKLFLGFLFILFLSGCGLSSADPLMLFSEKVVSEVAFTINKGELFTNQSKVSLQFNATSAQEMFLTTDPQCDVGGEWKPFVTEVAEHSLSDDTTQGIKKLYVKFRNAKLEETQCFMASITFDNLPPSTPTDLALHGLTSVVETQVISWTDSDDRGSGIKEYRGQVVDESSNSIVPETVLLNKDQFTGLNLIPGTKYFIQVRAVDNAGNESAFTDKLDWITPTGVTSVPGTSVSCPLNYVFVPSPADQLATGFCVAKYEMKKDDESGRAVSQAVGKPWVKIDRAAAQKACRDLSAGYDLISNSQWQTVARNVASVKENWRLPASGGFSNGSSQSLVVGSGSLSYGNSGGKTTSSYVLAANTDDSLSCGSGVCKSSNWLAKRTHVLSNGQDYNIIWDLSGNVEEWVLDDYSVADSVDKYISSLTTANSLQELFGTPLSCSSPITNNYCGFGFYWVGASARVANHNTIVRGGRVGEFQKAGVFANYLGYLKTMATDDLLGFRCVYVP